jgi:SOS response regulatory protein OraA/RecX
MSLLNNALGKTINTTINTQLNPLQLLSELKSGKISSNTVLTMLKRNNPQQVQQIEQMIYGKNQNQINQMINTLCQQKGVNLNDLIQLFKK